MVGSPGKASSTATRSGGFSGNQKSLGQQSLLDSLVANFECRHFLAELLVFHRVVRGQSSEASNDKEKNHIPEQQGWRHTFEGRSNHRPKCILELLVLAVRFRGLASDRLQNKMEGNGNHQDMQS